MVNIGIQNKFEIKYEYDNQISTSKYGKIIIVIDNHELGYYGDIVDINAVCWIIEMFLSPSFFISDFDIKKPALELLKILRKYDFAYISLGTAFDDFETKFYCYDGQLHIIWRMLENQHFEYEIIDNNCYKATFDVSFIKEILLDFEKSLKTNHI